MTEATTLDTGRRRETGAARVVALVCSAHFVSHVYILSLPPLFILIRAEYGLSYSELGMLVAVFNVLSMTLQAPAGFLVDRMAPSVALMLALVVGAAGMTLAGAVPTYWALVAGWAVVGVANTLYHPADYAILSDAVASKRIGQAFALHTFFGMLGTAAAPASMLFLAERWGWRGALLGAACLGFAAAVLLIARRSAFPAAASARARKRDPRADLRLILSPPILRNLMFFLLLAVAGAGISNFSIVALAALQGTSLAAGNVALSSFLVMNAAGVLAGGFLAMRTRRHVLVAVALLALSAFAILAIALLPLGLAMILAMMAVAGFFNGAVQPSRDMMVRAVTPDGSYGKVFGFVSVGFSIGGMIGPLVYGYLMDRNSPRLVFLVVVLFTVLALPFVRVPAAGTRGT